MLWTGQESQISSSAPSCRSAVHFSSGQLCSSATLQIAHAPSFHTAPRFRSARKFQRVLSPVNRVQTPDVLRRQEKTTRTATQSPTLSKRYCDYSQNESSSAPSCRSAVHFSSGQFCSSSTLQIAHAPSFHAAPRISGIPAVSFPDQLRSSNTRPGA